MYVSGVVGSEINMVPVDRCYGRGSRMTTPMVLYFLDGQVGLRACCVEPHELFTVLESLF